MVAVTVHRRQTFWCRIRYQTILALHNLDTRVIPGNVSVSLTEHATEIKDNIGGESAEYFQTAATCIG